MLRADPRNGPMEKKAQLSDHIVARLATGRQSLLATLETVDDTSLAKPTRNAEWTVRDVLAHVLASDVDLIWMLETARETVTGAARHHVDHEAEMARWADADVIAIRRAAREFGDCWQHLLAVMLTSAATTHVEIWWRTGQLGDVLNDYLDHDSQHADDIRLALANGSV